MVSSSVQYYCIANSLSLFVSDRNEMVGCKAYPGYGVRYPVTLDMTCLNSIGGIAHELGHVVGFLHEHNRRDRNQYIEILLDNIREERRRYYKSKSNSYTYVSTHYDLGSIMQYPPYNGDAINLTLPTFRLRPNVNYPGTIGQRECLSYLDIQSTNLLYKCRLRKICNLMLAYMIFCLPLYMIVHLLLKITKISKLCQ